MVIRPDKEFYPIEEVYFELLQFVDDTVIIGDGSWDNLWTIKAVLRGFELALGLYANLRNSKLILINLKRIPCSRLQVF